MPFQEWRPRAPSRQAERQQLRADPLADSLLYLAAHHGRALSREALLAGLPITDGQLTVALYRARREPRRARNRSRQAQARRHPCAGAAGRAHHARRQHAHPARGRSRPRQSATVVDPSEPNARAVGARIGCQRLSRLCLPGPADRRGRRSARRRRRRRAARALVLVGRQALLAELQPRRRSRRCWSTCWRWHRRSSS